MSLEETLLEEVADKRTKREDIAQTYALALKTAGYFDWRKINLAIVDRWSLSGLEWIKQSAWGEARSAWREAAKK